MDIKTEVPDAELESIQLKVELIGEQQDPQVSSSEVPLFTFKKEEEEILTMESSEIAKDKNKSIECNLSARGANTEGQKSAGAPLGSDDSLPSGNVDKCTKSFVCISFYGGKCEVVPRTWMLEKNGKLLCLWPEFGHIPTLVQYKVSPTESWSERKVKSVLATSDDYGRAVAKVKSQAAVTTASENEDEEVIITKRKLSRDDSDDPSVTTKVAKARRSQSSTATRKLHFGCGIQGKSQPGQISVALESLENKVTACIDSLRSEVKKLKTDITQHIDERWDTLIKNQEENHAEIKLIRKILKKSSQIIPMEDNKLPSFPLQSLEEMRVLENILEDDGQKQVLIRELELIGGRKLNQVVYNFMKHVMNKDVALSYSLKGAKKKLKFMDLILYRCILDAVRKNPKFAAATDEEINQYIGLSLVNARDRDKGRRSRLTPETPQVDSAHVDVSAADEEAGPSMA